MEFDPGTENLPVFAKEVSEKYLCTKCREVLAGAVRKSECGHRICQRCFVALFNDQEVVLCTGSQADCVSLTQNKLHSDRAAERALQCLEVYCHYRPRGCQKIVQWGKLKDHQSSCVHSTAVGQAVESVEPSKLQFHQASYAKVQDASSVQLVKQNHKASFADSTAMHENNPLSDILGLRPTSFRLHVVPNFAQPPDDHYKCEQCKHVLKPPVMQTQCGHRMCKACVDDMFRNEHEVCCPGLDDDCFLLSLSDIHPDRAADKELQQMKVFCNFRPRGCQHIVRWRDLTQHLTSCPYKSDPSPALSQNNLQQSQREIFQDSITQPSSEFLRLLSFARPSDDHYICERCKKILIPPVMQTLCGHRLCAKCVVEQLDQGGNVVCPVDDCVLLSFADVVPEKGGTKEILQMEVYCPNRENGCHDIIKWQDMHNHKEMCQFSQAKRHNGSSHPQSNFNNLERHMVPKCDTTRESRENQIKEKPTSIRALNIETSSMMKQEPVNRLECSIAMRDVRLPESEIRFRCLETTSYNGSLIWKITQYSARKEDAVAGRTMSLHSQPFYSSCNGYKMCARLYPNGNGLGKGSYLALFFVIMKGEYDTVVQWPFRHTVTLSILDQSGRRKHIMDTFCPDPTNTSFQTPAGEMNIASGCPLFVPQDKVESESYLKDDVLFVSVMLDKTGASELLS